MVGANKLPVVTFGVFRFDMQRLELENAGIRVRLAPQPAEVLRLLLEHPGQVVSREQIRGKLWPAGTHVEFELGLNTAVNRLRRVLNDSAESPRYVETVPKAGYRFVAPVNRPAEPAAADIGEPLSPVPVPRTGNRLWRILLPLALAGAAVSIWRFGAVPSVPAATRWTIPIELAAGGRIHDLAIAPRGDHFVYVADGGGRLKVYRRFFSETFSRRVEGSDDAQRVFVAPTGERLGIVVAAGIKILAPDGTSREVMKIDGSTVFSPVWGRDGFIYFAGSAGSNSGVWRVSADGGEAEPVIPTQATARGVAYVFPHQLLDDRLLFTTRRSPLQNTLSVYSVRDKTTSDVQFPAEGGLVGGGLLVFAQGEKLLGAPFDERAMRATGPAVTLGANVGSWGWTGPQAALTLDGVLIYVHGPPLEGRRIAWINAAGIVAELPLPAAEYEQVRVSPVDARLVGVVTREALNRWAIDIVNLDTKATTRLLTTAVGKPRLAWSPDGHSVVAGSERGNGDLMNLYRIDLGGKGEMKRLTEEPNFGQFPLFWSASRDELLFAEGVHPDTQSDIKAYSFRDRTVRKVLTTREWEIDGQISPDGRWLAYASGPMGEFAVYIAPYPNPRRTPPKRVGAGRAPVWLAKGDELAYSDHGKLYQISVRNGSGAGNARIISSAGASLLDLWTRPYDVAGDGRILTILRPEPKATRAMIEVVGNAGEEWRRLRD
ncbi:MAG: winged helix-turn-helix domain-containing protein [Bryobacteraceae bacterium]|nr:winged helix-turn-helix domain-containing protein [Bryobacteraceae bacterium]